MNPELRGKRERESRPIFELFYSGRTDRTEKKGLETGVCGEHGGELCSINYYRQAAIEDMAKEASQARMGLPVSP